MFFIQPTAQDIERALESWQWLPLSGKTVIRVTAFGDCFLQDDTGIWFLDTLEGKLSKAFGSADEMEAALNTEQGQDDYLLSGFVERAARENRLLESGQCYDYKLNPVVGGAVSYDNVCIRDFVVAVNLAGQLHNQIRNFPEGAKISGFTITD